MKFVAPSVSLLLSLSACGERAGDPPPESEAKVAARAPDVEPANVEPADVKAVADAKAANVEPADVQAVADAKAPDPPVADATPPGADAAPVVAADTRAPSGSGTVVSGFYWSYAVKDAGKSSIDVTDTAGEEVAKLVETNEGGDGIERSLSPTAVLPPGFALGDRWAVATTRGARRGKAVAFGAYGGASESHFIVVIDTVAEGLAARSGAWPGTVPTLRAARRVDTKSGPGLELVERIKAPIAATAEPDARRALGRKPIANKHLTVFEGRFPRGFTHLVALVRPLARPDDVGTEHVGGLLMVDANGNVEAITAPRMTIDSHEVLHLVDLEGDGIDEVVYDSNYYEGSYRFLLKWNAAGKPVLRVLGGDGA